MNYAGSPSHSPATLWFYTVVFTSVVPRPAASALPGNLCKKYRFLYPTPGCVHAKLLQSCPILCKPVDHSLPGSSVHGILQARILDWFAIPSSEDLPDPGMEPESLCLLHWQAGSLPLHHLGSPIPDLLTPKLPGGAQKSCVLTRWFRCHSYLRITAY